MPFTLAEREGRGAFLSAPAGPAPVSLPAHTMSAGAVAALPPPCEHRVPLLPPVLSHRWLWHAWRAVLGTGGCHSKEPAPKLLAKGMLMITTTTTTTIVIIVITVIITKTSNLPPPAKLRSQGKRAKRGRAWLASKPSSTCLPTQPPSQAGLEQALGRHCPKPKAGRRSFPCF